MVNFYQNQNQVLNDSIDRIVVETIKNKSDDRAALILLTGCSALSGTTTVSIALAVAIANTDRKVLLIDCDVRKAPKYKKLNQNDNKGLSDYLVEEENNISVDKIIQTTNIDGLFFLSCGSEIKEPTRALCSPSMDTLIEYSRKNFDFVIFDVPSLAIAPDASILFDKTDDIILLSALGETKKNQIKQAKRKILPYREKYLGMIINKVEASDFKKIIPNYDYYFDDGNGEQQLKKRIPKNVNMESQEEK